MQDKNHTQIEKGLSLPGARASSNGNGKTGNPATGKLYFQTRPTEAVLPGLMPGNKPDNSILNNALDLQTKHSARQGALVSKDINLPSKAANVGLNTDDNHQDQVLDDPHLLYTAI